MPNGTQVYLLASYRGCALQELSTLESYFLQGFCFAFRTSPNTVEEVKDENQLRSTTDDGKVSNQYVDVRQIIEHWECRVASNDVANLPYPRSALGRIHRKQ